MKLTAEMLTAAFLFASIGLAAHGLIAPGKTSSDCPGAGIVPDQEHHLREIRPGPAGTTGKRFPSESNRRVQAVSRTW